MTISAQLAQVTAAAQRQRVLVELQPTALNAEVDGDVADEIAEAPGGLTLCINWAKQVINNCCCGISRRSIA